MTARKSPWKIAEEWYVESQIARAIHERNEIGSLDRVPDDVLSPEFAKWLTNQYRLAMAKGIQLGREQLTNEQTTTDTEM